MATIRRVRTEFTGVAGSPWVSNMYFTWVNGTEQDHVDAVGVFWAAVDARIDNSVTWATESDVAVIDDTTGNITSMETTTPATGAGGGTSDPLPYQTQALCHWLTNSFLSGRQIRGKTFIPGLCEDDNTSTGLLVSTTQTIIQDAADALIAASSSPGPLRVFTRVNNTSVVVETASVPTKWALLRSRRD